MESIGVRLGSERHRLDLTQDELAKIGGVSRRAQARYESNRHSPTAAYLSAAAEAGLDVAYILTGRPSSTVNPQLLSKCIAALEKWQRQKERRLSPEGQAYAIAAIYRFSEEKGSLLDSDDIELFAQIGASHS